MGRHYKEMHRGDTLTSVQRAWLDKIRRAAKLYPANRKQAAGYLGVRPDTFLSWLRFFTGKRDWPAEISPEFDQMEVIEPPTHRWTKDTPAPPDECQRLKQVVDEWLVKVGMPISALASITFIPEAILTELVRHQTITAYSAHILDRAMRGGRVWSPKPVTDYDIELRKRAVEQEREERERRLLEEERVKYGLRRQAKPLSRMPV